MGKLNTKILTFSFFILIVSNLAYSIPADPTPHLIIQPDNTSFYARLTGDEFIFNIQTLEGYEIRKDTRGWWKYVEGNVLTDYKVGKIDSKQTKLDRYSLDTPLLKKINRPTLSSPDVKLVTGNQDVLVLLIQFTDITHSKSVSDLDNLIFGENNDKSMYNYYKENSFGKLSITGNVNPTWYTSSHTMVYYGADTGTENNDPWPPDDGNGHIGELAREVIRLADNDIDFSQYDKNGDGIVDHLLIVHSGGDQATCDFGQFLCGNYIWSQKQNIPGNEPADGVEISGFTLLSEDDLMGVYAHEFGHDLGLPDLYDTDKTGSNGESIGVGTWDLMAAGGLLPQPLLGILPIYGAVGSVPGHLSAWSKIQLGWIEPIIIENSGPYSLPQAETSSSKIYKININKNEYFLIENREKTGFDSYLLGDGALVYHIDDSVGEIYLNNVNVDPTHKRVDVEETHGGTQNLDDISNLGDSSDPLFDKCWWITNWFCQPHIFTQNTDPNTYDYSGGSTNIGIIATTKPQEIMGFKAVKPRILSVPDTEYGFTEPSKYWQSTINVPDISKLEATVEWSNSDQLKLTLIDPYGQTYTSNNPRSDGGIKIESILSTKMQETNESKEQVQGLTEGIWYFHVVAMDNVGNLGNESGHYKFSVGENKKTPVGDGGSWYTSSTTSKADYVGNNTNETNDTNEVIITDDTVDEPKDNSTVLKDDNKNDFTALVIAGFNNLIVPVVLIVITGLIYIFSKNPKEIFFKEQKKKILKNKKKKSRKVGNKKLKKSN